jgi:hypothetical protein
VKKAVGEAKRKHKLKQQLLAENPYCIYCGGVNYAATIDHFPPISLFELRQRPKGLEFSACERCNSGGKKDELVASMLSRLLPDPSSDALKEENRNLIRSVHTNCPGILEEMNLSPRQENIVQPYVEAYPSIGGAFNCSGPLLARSIHRFGAKIGFALHFHLTKRIVSENGGVCVWWFTNEKLFTGDLPWDLINMLGNPNTLRQGKREVSNQFLFARNATTEGTLSGHYATFRLSFAICAFVAEDIKMLTKPENVKNVSIHRPGFLLQEI